jgi:hypothetical protein
MNTKLYLTIAGIVAILYGIIFVLFPANVVVLYGGPPESHVILNVQFFGSALLALGVIMWFARDFRDWAAMRGVLIGAVVGDVAGVLVNILGTIQGTVNALGWSSTVVYVLLLLGALYCLFTGSRKPA